MRDLPKFFAVVFALLSSSACEIVSLDRPLGESPVTLDASEIDGAWYLVGKKATPFKIKATPFYLRSLSDGTVILAGVDRTKDGFELQQVQVHIMSIGDQLYVSGISPDDKLGERFLFARLDKIHDTEWVLLPPKIETFHSAVIEGRLEGKVYKTHIEVDGAQVVDFIRTTPADGVWNADNAILVRKFEPNLQ